MPNSLLLPLSLLSLLVMAAPQAALAETDCPSGISPKHQRRSLTDDKHPIPLTQPILYDIEALDGLYRIPVGYSWESASGINVDAAKQMAAKKLKGISFKFWMPSLRYPERNTQSLTSFRPCEDGRPAAMPDQSAYLVHVRIVPMDPQADETIVTPLDMYRNKINSIGGEKDYSFSEVYGLRRFESRKTLDLKRSLYRHVDGTVPELYMDCAEPSPAVANPSCRGYFYFPQADLFFQMSFATQDLRHWQDMVIAVRELLKRWHAKGPRGA
jgi:hypothetical protein